MRMKGQPSPRTRSFSRVDRAMPVYSAASQVRSMRRFEDDLNERMSYPIESPEAPGNWVGLDLRLSVAQLIFYATSAGSWSRWDRREWSRIALIVIVQFSFAVRFLHEIVLRKPPLHSARCDFQRFSKNSEARFFSLSQKLRPYTNGFTAFFIYYPSSTIFRARTTQSLPNQNYQVL